MQRCAEDYKSLLPRFGRQPEDLLHEVANGLWPAARDEVTPVLGIGVLQCPLEMSMLEALVELAIGVTQ